MQHASESDPRCIIDVQYRFSAGLEAADLEPTGKEKPSEMVVTAKLSQVKARFEGVRLLRVSS